MKRSTLIIRSIILLFLTVVTFSSCVKKDYDDIVTANVDPNITVTHTIHQLQAYATGPVGVLITDDIIIAGIVVGDDETGNIYKSIILQQDSSGIAIELDLSNFYTEYAVGRHIFVKCKGLYISNNEGNFELGSTPTNPVSRILPTLRTKYLFKGKWGQYITPKIYTLATAETTPTSIPTNTLVKFENVEFEAGSNGIEYAATTGSNLPLEDCALPTHNLVVYSSNYATFAKTPTPLGKGSIVGVYSIYSGSGELQIRTLRDVNMPDTRCDGSTGVTTLMTLDSIRLLDPGAANVTYLPVDKRIEVVVTSDFSTNMLTGAGKNIYVQDGTAAIQIRFTAAHSFAIGTKLTINVSGMELSTFSGVLQINLVPLGSAIPTGTGSVTPRLVTIADVNANYDTWEGQVVKFDNVTITGSGVYNSVNTLNDASLNTIELYTTPSATFAADSTKTGNVSVTGILTEYNGTKEILMRNLLDVQ